NQARWPISHSSGLTIARRGPISWSSSRSSTNSSERRRASTTASARGVWEIDRTFKLSPFVAAERLAEHGQALGKRRPPVLLALELQRDIAAVLLCPQNRRDALVVQIQRVPDPTPVVCLRLHECRQRCDLLQLVVRVFEEVAGVHQHAQPGRVDGLDDAQQ